MATFSAGTADVEIGPNFTNFVRDLREDLDEVQANLGVEINPDFTNFVRQLQDYLDLVVASLAVEINPDLTNFATDLEDRLALIQAHLDVEINPDTTDFAAELALKLAVIHQAFDIKVGVDQTSLDNLETLIRAKLAAMDLRVDVQVGADTRVAADELALLKASYREMTMRVDADTSAAAAQIGALNGIPVTANVRANTGKGGLLSGLNLGEPLILSAGALGLSQLPALATSVASIGVDMQALVQNALLLPGVFAAAGAGIATLMVGLDGFKDAFAEGKKGEEAFQKMSADGRALVTTVKSYKDEWDGVGARIQNITLAGLTDPVDRLLSTQIPALDRGMGVVAESMNRGLGTLVDELGSGKSVATVDKVFGNTAKTADILNTAIRPIISSVETLAGTGSDKLPRLAQGFADAATRFDNFLDRADRTGDLDRWMDDGIDAAGRLVSVLGNLGSILASVLRAGKGDGEGFLATTDRLTERWATFLKSTEGQSHLKAFFEQGSEQMDRWQPLLSSVGSLLKSVYEASQAWSAILLPFLTTAANLLGEHDGILRTVLISYLAYRTLSPIFALIQTGWNSAQAAVGRYNTAQAAAAGSGATAMRSSIGGLAAALGTGGALTIGLIGAAALVGVLAQKHQDAATAAAEQKRKLDELRETLAASGDVTQETISTTAKDLTSRGFLERASTLGISGQKYVEAGLGLDPTSKAQINQRLTSIILEQQGDAAGKFDQVGQYAKLSDTQIAQALQGVPEAVKQYTDAVQQANVELAASGIQLPDLTALKNGLTDIGESAATLGGEMNGLGTNTAKAGEQMRQYQAAAEGTFALTEEGKRQFAELGVAVTAVPSAKTIVIDAPTADQRARLSELSTSVHDLPNGKVEITLNDAAAKAGIAQIIAPAVKNVTVNFTPNTQSIPSSVIANSKDLGYAEGGPIVGGIPGRDSVPIMAMPGEHMLTTSEVDKMGGQAGVYRFRAALNAGLVRPMKDGGAVGWTEQNEIDLQQAQNAVDKAKQARQELEGKKGTDDNDRRGADLKIEELELRVRNLESKKAGKSGTAGGEILPQAELPGKRSNADLDKEDADSAVDQANSKRNKVYSDPASTDEQKRAADRDYQRAQNSRAETYKSKSTGDDANISLPGIAAKGAGFLAEGFLAFFGLENSVLSGNNVYTKSLGKVIDFYGNKAKEQEGEGYGYTPKNLPQDKTSESSSSDGSSSSSTESKSSSSYDAGGGVEQWRGTFGSVLRALSMPAAWLDLGLAQMRTESGGNPKAINNWDSNAAKGTPSKGLMQVIDPTFASNRSEMYPNDIWDPGANIAAALQYTVRRYKTPVGVWGQGHGYAEGGWVFGPGGPRDDLVHARVSPGEFVVNAAAAGMNAPALEAINAGLPMPLPPLPTGMKPRGGDTNLRRDHSINFHAPMTVADPGTFIREMERHQALQAQASMAGLPR